MNLICRFSTETPIVREYDFLFIEKKKKNNYSSISLKYSLVRYRFTLLFPRDISLLLNERMGKVTFHQRGTLLESEKYRGDKSKILTRDPTPSVGPIGLSATTHAGQYPISININGSSNAMAARR